MNTSDLIHFLAPELPGCPDAVIKQHLVQAAIEFCTETLAWQEIQEPTIVVDRQNLLDVDAPRDARIVTVRDIWANSRKLRPVTMAQLFEVIPNWQTAQGSEPTYYNASTDWRSISIFPIPVEANRAKLTMRVAYAPKLTATTLPDEICTKYLDGLLGGTKSRLMIMPGKTWTNAQMAIVYRTQFTDQMLKAKIDDMHDRVQGSLSVRPHPFA
jgi:hypothetical protein